MIAADAEELKKQDNIKYFDDGTALVPEENINTSAYFIDRIKNLSDKVKGKRNKTDLVMFMVKKID